MDHNNPTTTVSVNSVSSVTPTPPEIQGPISLLKFAWSMFVSRWKSIVPIVVVPSAVGYIGGLFTLSPGNVFFGIIAVVASVSSTVLSIAMLPALIDVVRRISIDPGTPIVLKDQYRFGFSYFWSIVFIGILMSLVGMGSFMLFVIPGIIIGVYASLYAYALVIDGKKGFSAFIESYSLIKGRWLAVFGRALFLSLISLVVWIVLVALISPFASNPATFKIVGGLFNLVVTSILTPIAIAYSYRMYVDLKSLRKSDIPTKTFKNWLVGFMCVGVLALLVILVSVPVIISRGFGNIRPNADTNSYTRYMEILQGDRPGGAGQGSTSDSQ